MHQLHQPCLAHLAHLTGSCLNNLKQRPSSWEKNGKAISECDWVEECDMLIGMSDVAILLNFISLFGELHIGVSFTAL